MNIQERKSALELRIVNLANNIENEKIIKNNKLKRLEKVKKFLEIKKHEVQEYDDIIKPDYFVTLGLTNHEYTLAFQEFDDELLLNPYKIEDDTEKLIKALSNFIDDTEYNEDIDKNIYREFIENFVKTKIDMD